MITKNSFKEFSHESDEGKLLLAALAVLTSISTADITDGKWGGCVHPDDAFKKIVDLANQVFYKEELQIELDKTERDNKINTLITNVIL